MTAQQETCPLCGSRQKEHLAFPCAHIAYKTHPWHDITAMPASEGENVIHLDPHIQRVSFEKQGSSSSGPRADAAPAPQEEQMGSIDNLQPGYEPTGESCHTYKVAPAPAPQEILGFKVRLDPDMPVGQIDVEDSNGKRTTVFPAPGSQTAATAEQFLCREENQTGLARTSRWTWQAACVFAEAYAAQVVAERSPGSQTADEWIKEHVTRIGGAWKIDDKSGTLAGLLTAYASRVVAERDALIAAPGSPAEFYVQYAKERGWDDTQTDEEWEKWNAAFAGGRMSAFRGLVDMPRANAANPTRCPETQDSRIVFLREGKQVAYEKWQKAEARVRELEAALRKLIDSLPSVEIRNLPGYHRIFGALKLCQDALEAAQKSLISAHDWMALRGIPDTRSYSGTELAKLMEQWRVADPELPPEGD